ncbi:MAG: ABC transporter substrate-binding protein [Phycisphaeraceae bacterium]
MREHLSKIFVVSLLVLVVGVPFVMRQLAAEDEIALPADAPRLIVLSPHNEQIRYEMARGFNRWRTEQGLAPVRFDWRAGGGTSDLRKQVLAQFESAASRGAEDAGIGADLFFGGGEFEHNMLARGVTVVRNDEEVSLSTTVPPEIDPALIDEAFPSRHIGSAPLYHEDRYWIGTTLSSFGIVYNRDVLDMLGVDPPTTWADLADPRLRGWVALADPSHSGSIAAAYHAILQRLGWTEGWDTLRMIFANARYFAASSSKVPVDVSNGEAAVGMAIDFYGRYQAGAVNAYDRRANPDAAADSLRMGYVDPVRGGDGERVSLTATTADPISLLRGAPHRELAEQFIAWVLTKDAQRLWQRRKDAPGGPEKFELRRQPIRLDLYTPDEREHWTDAEIDPFATAQPFPDAMPDFYSMVAPISHAMAIDVHSDLTAAWDALQATPEDDPAYAAMHEVFFAMPEVLTLTWPDEEIAQNWPQILANPEHPRYDAAAGALADLKQRWGEAFPTDLAELKARVAWTKWYRDQYEKAAVMP